MSVRLLLPAAFALAFGATFLVALHTSTGLREDAALYRHVSGSAGTPVRTAGQRALETIDVGSLVLGIVVVSVLALVRGRVRRAVAAAAVVLLSLATTELLKQELPHPVDRGATFPSGHASIAASLGLALVVAVPSVLRPLAAVLGAAYAAAVALALVVLASHYPSDVVASFCVAGFWASAAAAVVATPRRPHAIGLALSAVVVAAGLLVTALLAVRHPAAVGALRTDRALAAAAGAIGAVSVVTFAAVTGFSEDA